MADTCLELIKDAFISIGVIGVRDALDNADAAYGLRKLQQVITALPGWDVWNEVEIDGSEPYFAGANERIAVIASETARINLPQMVRADRMQLASLPGLIVAAEGSAYYAAPRDCCRVLIYAQQRVAEFFYAYRADSGLWISVIGLEYVSPLPMNKNLHGYLEATLAVAIEGAYGTGIPESVGKTYRDGQDVFAARSLVVGNAKIEGGVSSRRCW